MDKDLFYNWLKNFKKLDTTTSNARTSNCLRIEKFYGDLDKVYYLDRCTSLLEQLNFTTTDKKLGAKPKHKIPIDGDIYNGTHTLKAALKAAETGEGRKNCPGAHGWEPANLWRLLVCS